MTDRASSRIKDSSKENLTINYLLETLPLPPDIKSTLQGKVAHLNEITKPMREARNKIIAHADKEVFLNNQTFGAFEKGKDQEFFDILDDVVNTMHQTLNGGPYSIKVSAAGGPADDLIRKLRSLQRRKID